MALDLSSIVDVRADIAPQGLLQREFGRTLFLVRHDATRPFERLRVYSNFDQVATDYGPDDAAYQAALIYFQQQPFPPQSLDRDLAERGRGLAYRRDRARYRCGDPGLRHGDRQL